MKETFDRWIGLAKPYLSKYPFLWNYIVAVTILVVGFLLLRIIKTLLLRRLKRWSDEAPNTLAEFLEKTIRHTVFPVLYFGLLYLSTRGLAMNPTLTKFFHVVGVVLVTFFVVRFMGEMIDYLIKEQWIAKHSYFVNGGRIKALAPIAKVLIWGIGLIFLLDNLGFKVSSVIAGLGIGGIAIALASQNILGDLFNYFVIVFDTPFEIGDFIIIGEYLGEIEHIGIKTTRVRSLGGEQLVFSNTDLTNARIRNYKRMMRRRVIFKIETTYQTSLAHVKEIPEIITEIIKEIKDTIFDRSHFFAFGDSSLVFESVYYIIGSDYNKYMDIQQTINFKIKEQFEAKGIEFAYPTRTIYLKHEDGNREKQVIAQERVPEEGRPTGETEFVEPVGMER